MANISTWSTTAANNNAATPDGWPEGQAPSTVNNCGREMMAAVRTWFEDAQWINLGNTPTRVDNDTITIAGDVATIYTVGRRVKFVGATTGYATITASNYGAPNTTIDVLMDSGNVPTSLVSVAVGIVTPSNSALPLLSGTFTGTLTGMTIATTGTVNYKLVGQQVMLFVEVDILGTSNTTAMTMTGLPSALIPTSISKVCISCVRDNAIVLLASAAITGVTGVIQFRPVVVTGSNLQLFSGVFTASGSKGLIAGTTMSYPVG